MSLVTVSTKKNRVYHRAFDHEEAKRLREEEGWTYTRIADHFGVSTAGVLRVLNPKYRTYSDRQTNAYHRKRRTACKGGCGKLVWNTTKGRTGYCQQCLAARMVAADVREDELRCTRCRQWRPDDEFPLAKIRNGKRKNFGRRHKHCWCRQCVTAVRREFRHAHREQERVTTRQYDKTVRTERRNGMAEYIVLKQEGEGRYEEVSHEEAGSADLAIERAVQSPGAYVAVLVSRFEIVEVAPQTSLQVVRK